MKTPKFITSRRWLTNSALACGYVETQDQEVVNKGAIDCPDFQGKSISMWLEHGVYHIRAHDHTEGQRILWECKDTLPEARKFFTQCLKDHKLSRKMNF